MKKKISVLILAQVAMLLAMEVILSRFFFIATPVTKFSFAFVPLAVCGALFGPVYGGIMGALADLLGATLFPIGPYFPGYTLNNALHGVALGMALKEGRRTWWQLALALVFNHVVIGIFLAALWGHMLTDNPYWAVAGARVVQAAVMAPVQFIIIRLMQRPVERYADLSHRRGVA